MITLDPAKNPPSELEKGKLVLSVRAPFRVGAMVRCAAEIGEVILIEGQRTHVIFYNGVSIVFEPDELHLLSPV